VLATKAFNGTSRFLGVCRLQIPQPIKTRSDNVKSRLVPKLMALCSMGLSSPNLVELHVSVRDIFVGFSFSFFHRAYCQNAPTCLQDFVSNDAVWIAMSPLRVSRLQISFKLQIKKELQKLGRE
jgi:hypothetical protein